ncbi:MAG: DNA-formamidopyrimidine glycosylase [Stappia sp.]|uniref:bifunctional DNA-formamidopyrimidine glycosylase/DNA-(apurinic or apyrimidinic site) lyase n=1 Tax=Stappia sp. TaxID=1870903 RepID=UPI000C443E5F|nr:bifunctional DNA-formamidopyrimidine glycosylase/DNA-(apurinic or apyrimidinic site) lyase [Stappia sp.]MBM19359.1 DNA-formamidopyrimidine glycosylase [Stappia sp.]
MPELPEVETVRRGLAPVFEGARVERLHLARPDLRFPFPDGFAKAVEGREVTALGRRAKYLLADLDDGAVIVMHLGMSGAFRIEAGGDGAPGEVVGGAAFVHPRSEARKHDHVVFDLATAAGMPMRIVYNDPRRFGFMTMTTRAGLESHPLFSHLGLEPTGNALSGERLAELFAGRRTPLKTALLDQRMIAGLGNIYVCEALHRAGLSPVAPAGSLATAKGKAGAGARRLAEAVRTVLEEAIAAGGSTLRDHRQANGELGYFQHSFAVYGREGEPCRRAGCGGTIARLVQSGRSTFHCPVCQK